MSDLKIHHFYDATNNADYYLATPENFAEVAELVDKPVSEIEAHYNDVKRRFPTFLVWEHKVRND